jgi:hypothetical protein
MVPVVPTLVAPSAGTGDDGAAGGGGVDGPVVNDQTAPGDEPLALCAMICQKYRVSCIIAGEYDSLVCPSDTRGGGFVVPNFTSKVVAFCASHDKVAVVLTTVAPSGGLGENGELGGFGFAMVVNDQTDPGVDPMALRAVICQKYLVL